MTFQDFSSLNPKERLTHLFWDRTLEWRIILYNPNDSNGTCFISKCFAFKSILLCNTSTIEFTAFIFIFPFLFFLCVIFFINYLNFSINIINAKDEIPSFTYFITYQALLITFCTLKFIYLFGCKIFL